MKHNRKQTNRYLSLEIKRFVTSHPNYSDLARAITSTYYSELIIRSIAYFDYP